MSIGDRIKEARENKKLSRNELAERAGVTISAISNYENNISSPKEPILLKLMDILAIDANFLFQDMVEKKPTVFLTPSESTLLKKYRKLDDLSKELVEIVIDKELERSGEKYLLNDITADFDNYKEIPCYPKLAAAGTGQYVFDDIPFDMVRVDAKKYKKADYAIQVNGDSMEPTYYDGDTLIVERYEVPEVGETGIFIVDGMGYVKRMGKDELISDNKAYDNVKGIDGVCMGKVLGKV